ncbi:MAG: hypothetical protein HC904_07025 [Blastochloris sp.]|nr:hypothetical protein [Blastochloris sp.]
MSKKIQRSAPSPVISPTISDRGAVILTVGHVTAETAKAGAEVYKATANLISTTSQSLAECGKAYFNYLEECQRTHQIQIWSNTVIAEAREQTRRAEISSETAIAEAREQTRQIEIQAQLVLEHLTDIKASRDAKMEVVRSLLDEHRRLNQLFMSQTAMGIGNLPIDDRVHLAELRDEVLQRLRDLEAAITSLTASL